MRDIYFDESRLTYFVRAEDGNFIHHNETQLTKELIIMELSNDGKPSQIDLLLSRIRKEHYVNWSGSLAGHWAGGTEINGKLILVTDSPRIIKANVWSGRRGILYDYFERLLGPEQSIHFFIWLKLAREALLAKSLRRGPTIILVGSANHGKTLGFGLVNLMLGGRQADPTQFAQGDTTFNAHLFGCELLLADDKGGGRDDYHARLQTASVIKQLTADQLPECHGKNKTPLNLTPFWRAVFVCNDEANDLKVLPALSRGIMDKLLIFKTVGRAIDRPTETAAQYEAYRARLTGAIPDFLGWLESWAIPKKYLHGRFGQVVYHNQEVLDALQRFAPENKLLDLMGSYFFASTAEPTIAQRLSTAKVRLADRRLFNGLIQDGFAAATDAVAVYTAHDLETMLRMEFEREAYDLLKGLGSCAKYLDRLTMIHAPLIREVRRETRRSEDGKTFGGAVRYAINVTRLTAMEDGDEDDEKR
ncbi:MAG: DUF5906 domain-containing protein [Chthoniobacterales bacterium]